MRAAGSTSRSPNGRPSPARTLEAYKGCGWLDAVHPDDREATPTAWAARSWQTGSTYTIEHRLRRADGVWRHMAATAVPILDDDGSVREWVGSHADITERKEAELELDGRARTPPRPPTAPRARSWPT